jgi:hypothetical protein
VPEVAAIEDFLAVVQKGRIRALLRVVMPHNGAVHAHASIVPCVRQWASAGESNVSCKSF